MANGTVNLPLVGPTSKTAVWVGVGLGTAAGVYGYYRHEKTKAAAAAAAAQSQNQHQGAYGYGYGYGQGAYGYGSYGASPYAYGIPESPYSQYGYGYGLGDYFPEGGGYYPGYPYYGYGVQQTPVAAPSTNPAWVQAATTQLTNGGYSYASVVGALGRYIAGQSLNENQVSIVEAAIALEGDPPTAGAGGYPPAIRQSQGGGGTGQNGGGTNTRDNVPSVVGDTWEQGTRILNRRGFKVSKVPSNPRKYEKVSSQSPAAGAHIKPGDTVTLHVG